MDYLALYDIEEHLFDVVSRRFQADGSLTAHDFFCILIWKANRAKSTIAQRLLKKGYSTLDAAVYDLTVGLSRLTTPKERLRFLWEGNRSGLYVPMASAILTVLYPDDFTVYDTRVCGVLGDYHNLTSITVFENLWPRYQEFKARVEQTAPTALTPRDKDRYLWGKAFHEQLVADISQGFSKTTEE